MNFTRQKDGYSLPGNDQSNNHINWIWMSKKIGLYYTYCDQRTVMNKHTQYKCCGSAFSYLILYNIMRKQTGHYFLWKLFLILKPRKAKSAIFIKGKNKSLPGPKFHFKPIFSLVKALFSFSDSGNVLKITENNTYNQLTQ